MVLEIESEIFKSNWTIGSEFQCFVITQGNISYFQQLAVVFLLTNQVEDFYSNFVFCTCQKERLLSRRNKVIQQIDTLMYLSLVMKNSGLYWNIQNTSPSVQEEDDDDADDYNNGDYDYPCYKTDINSSFIHSQLTLCCNCIEHKK